MTLVSCFRYILLFSVIILKQTYNCQNEVKKWPIPQSNVIVDFMSNPPSLSSVTNNVVFASKEGTAMADINGDLLCSFDGTTLRNKFNTAMPSNPQNQINTGSGLGDVIIKKPGNNNLYYLFGSNPSGVNYAIFDPIFTSSSGTGTLLVGSTYFSNVPSVNCVTAVKHCNGHDIWILTADYNTNNFRTFLLTSAGINTVAVVSTNLGFQHLLDLKMKFSPSGKKVVLVDPSQTMKLLDFDASTGVVSNLINFPGNISGSNNSAAILGLSSAEFSPDETKLYGSSIAFNGRVYQWNLCAGSTSAILASQYTVSSGSSSKGSIELGPNGKIYISKSANSSLNSTSLAVINNPNNLGNACNFVENGLSLAPGQCAFYLLNFMRSYLYQPMLPLPFTYSLNPTQSCRTLTFNASNPTSNCALSNYAVTSVNWNFGDPISSTSNTSSSLNPVHVFSSPGVYTVQLVYNYVCGSDTLRQILSINGPTLNISSSPVTCSTQGSASVTTIGGTGPFTFSWAPAIQTNSTASGLTSGNYTLFVNDVGAGCVTKTVISIASNYVFTGSVSNSNLFCHSANNATASVIVNGGTGNYNYLWSNSTQSTSSINNLAAGNYTVTVTDINGPCTYSNTFAITQPPPLLLSIIASTLSACVGNSIGLSALVSGGTGGCNHLWSNGSMIPSIVFTPTVSGNYAMTLTATDANNCNATQTVALNFINGPALSVINQSICSGYVASLTLNGASTATWQPSNHIGLTFTCNPISNMVYTITGIAAGCIATSAVEVTVNVVPPPNLNLSLSSNSFCAQALNGSPNSITLTAAGASNYTLSTPNYFHNQNPGGPYFPIILLPPFQNTGPATATLYGSNGVCTVSSSAVYTIVPNPTVSVYNPTPVICAGQSFTYTSHGANSFVWSSSTPGSTLYTTGNIAVANPSINSVFSVFGGSLGCNSASQSMSIKVNPLPTVSISPNPTFVCLGKQSALNALGNGTAFVWSSSAYANFNNNQSVQVAPVKQETYTVVASLNNCTNAAVATVSVMPLPSPTITSNKTVLCLNEELRLQGSGAKEYDWLGPNNLHYSGALIKIPMFNLSYAGQYTLTASDTNTCVGRTTGYIQLLDLPTGYLKSNQTYFCVPFCADYKFEINPNTQSSVKGFAWRINETFVSANKNFSYCFSKAGDYQIKGDLQADNGCVNSILLNIRAYPKPKADFDFQPKEPIENMDLVYFENLSNNGNKFQWEISTLNESQNRNTSYLFREAGIYPIVLQVTNEFNCSDTIIKTIKVLGDYNVYIPNAFTPNGNGNNDTFLPVVRNTKNFELRIFNRWGEEIFFSKDSSQGWDGKNKGIECENGSYTYKLKIKPNNEDERTYLGTVILIR